MAKTVQTLAPVIVVPSAADTYKQGLEMAEMIDDLNFKLHGVKTRRAKFWRKEFGKFAEAV